MVYDFEDDQPIFDQAITKMNGNILIETHPDHDAPIFFELPSRRFTYTGLDGKLYRTLKLKDGIDIEQVKESLIQRIEHERTSKDKQEG